MQFPDTRRSLIARLHNARDNAAWGEFCAIYEPTCYQIARRFGLQDADAREVSQEVLRPVCRKITSFDLHRDGRFRGWLGKLARHATIDLLRRRRETATGRSDVFRRLTGIPDKSHDTDGQDSDHFDVEARRQQFRWAADQVRHVVSAKTWQAFWLTAVDGMAAEQVAEQLAMSVGAVYVARCRTLARIKKLLEPFSEEST